MITAVILFSLAFLFSIPTDNDNAESTNKENFFACICAIVAVVIILFWIVGNNIMFSKEYVYESTPYSTQYIVALKDNNMMQGKYYLQRGYIGEDLYYQYLMKWNDGYKANKIKASNAVIYESNSNYRVEWYKGERRWLCFSDTTKMQKIYIPEGSIEETFIVDLE